MEDVGIRLRLEGRRELASGLQDGEQGFDQLGQAAEDAGKKAETSGRRFDRTRSILGSVGRGMLFGVKAAGALAAAGAAVGIKTAAGMQSARIGFTTMLGSARKAGKFLRDLSDFAARTPFEFPELQTAASRLVSAGIETRKVIPIMTTLGDVTAGMGTGAEGITRATNALQQMSAAGRISGEDLNQLRDAGIPVFDLLASAMGKTKAEVIALKDQGKLGGDAFTAMMKALETGKGLERFNGLMAKQSDTLAGRWSTLKDTVTMGLAGAIKPAQPLLKDLLGLADRLARGALPKIQGGVRSMAVEVRGFVKTWKQSGFKGALQDLSAPGVPNGAAGIAGSLAGIGSAIKDIKWGAVRDGLGQGTADTITVFGVAISFAAKHVDELAKYLPFLVVGLAAFKVAQAAGNIAALASIPTTALQIGSNLALASALRANTAATLTNAGAENVSRVSKIASTVATIAQTTATKLAAAGQWLLNAAMTANPIGLVIAAVALLVGGFILLYNKSDTFRGLIDVLWNLTLKPFAAWIGDVLITAITWIASGLLAMAANGVMSFRILLQAAFKAFDGILLAAETGLGWIPGIGDKIKGARAAFDQFGDSVINKLQKVEDRLRKTQAAVDGIAKDRTATITIFTKNVGAAHVNSGPGFGPDMRANGGPVVAGRPYVVGERRAELFVPRVNGRILPRVPDAGPADPADVDPAAFDATPMAGRGPRDPIHVTVELDGRVLAETTVNQVANAQARR